MTLSKIDAARKSTSMSTNPKHKRAILIIPGATGGGWQWLEVARILRSHGHDVHPITLTGLGERSHLASSAVNLTTHILDVVNTIRWNGLEGAGIVLAGHSYGGTVISGVAELVAEGAIAAGVFLDAAVPDDGQSQYDYMGIPTPKPNGIFAPPLDGGHVASSGSDEASTAELRTPQPMGTFTESLTLTGARERIPVLMYVAGSENRIWERRPQVHRLRNDPRWLWRELPCGHDLYVMPEEVANLIMEAANI
jgi:pimeloyl-ACP methyl ester carboxylesterase